MDKVVLLFLFWPENEENSQSSFLLLFAYLTRSSSRFSPSPLFPSLALLPLSRSALPSSTISALCALSSFQFQKWPCFETCVCLSHSPEEDLRLLHNLEMLVHAMGGTFTSTLKPKAEHKQQSVIKHTRLPPAPTLSRSALSQAKVPGTSKRPVRQPAVDRPKVAATARQKVQQPGPFQASEARGKALVEPRFGDSWSHLASESASGSSDAASDDDLHDDELLASVESSLIGLHAALDRLEDGRHSQPSSPVLRTGTKD